MTIEIILKKILSKDGKKLVQMKIDGMLNEDELPAEYVSGCPMIACEHSYTTKIVRYRLPELETDGIARPEEHRTDLPLDPKLVEQIVHAAQVSGDRLHKIQAELRRKAALYEGTSKITI